MLRGEATPVYIYWPGALERLRAYNPDARLIVGLRHPVFRAYSHWRMERHRGRERLDFGAAIAAGRARVARAPGGVHRVFSYVEPGLYAGQIRRLLDLFPRRQVLFYLADELWAEPAATLGRIEAHLGLGRPGPADFRTTYTSPVAIPPGEPMPPEARATLDDLFRADLRETAALAGLDLAAWLHPAYAEPMRPPAPAAP